MGSEKLFSGELLEAPWRLPELSWRFLESLAGALGVLGAVREVSREVPGAVLEAHKALLERSLGRLGAILGALEAMLQPPGGQNAPKIVAQEGPKSISFRYRFRDRFGVRFGHPKIMNDHTSA